MMETLMQTSLIKKHKDKIINTTSTRDFNIVHLTITTFMDKRESFYYIIENIT